MFCLLISIITERKNYTQPIFSYSAERRRVGHVLEGYAGSIGVIAWHRHTLHGRIYYIWRLFYTNSFATSAGLAKVGALYSGPTYIGLLFYAYRHCWWSANRVSPVVWATYHLGDGREGDKPTGRQASKQVYSPKTILYDYINTKCKQYNGRLPEGNPSIELVANCMGDTLWSTGRQKLF